MLTFAEERFSRIENELRGLIHAHWEEVADNKGQIPLDPDWARLRDLETAGVLKVLAARDDGVLAGYVIHIITPSLHYRSLLTAHDDAHYLKPEYRKGWAAVRMIRAAEQMLRSAGVNAITYHSKVRDDIDRGAVFERLGYRPIERLFTKILSAR